MNTDATAKLYDLSVALEINKFIFLAQSVFMVKLVIRLLLILNFLPHQILNMDIASFSLKIIY